MHSSTYNRNNKRQPYQWANASDHQSQIKTRPFELQNDGDTDVIIIIIFFGILMTTFKTDSVNIFLNLLKLFYY